MVECCRGPQWARPTPTLRRCPPAPPPPCPPVTPPPGLLFFTTYTLLVLFWAEIYQQARNLPAAALRPAFLGINVLVYSVLVGWGLPRKDGGGCW